MSHTYEKQQFEILCPNEKCKRGVNITYVDAYNSRKAKCSKCGTEVTFDSGAASQIRSAISDINRNLEKLAKAASQIMKNAQIKLKG